jgi:hypothetical protein
MESMDILHINRAAPHYVLAHASLIMDGEQMNLEAG